MESITVKMLDETLAILNYMTKRQYGFYIGYGGYKLIDYVTHKEITTYRLTKREMYYVLQAMIATLENENK